ncbi:uncharacterized protein BJ212DRAFT_1256638 [Suillus subaureus]|uniref:CCHC-type domain-containing protein n=1 Tax=Suillus subaureus TaxID=48587 RepID=A0A9P7JK20_9AGAM|nr:uncharacterized protein BJ212DRAFT_1256638 [Suillus subaureus]KAG1827349.1 hypothetical protein BJ212DRAFT_1256638 [Suillus subaureus]
MPKIFHRDGCKSKNPMDFLKSFNQAMRQQSITMLTDKIEAFGNYLGTGSDAEIWFKVLTASSKATWAAFVVKFEVQWLPIIVTEKTKAEFKRELMEHLLSDTDVGTKTTLYNRECWMHEAWVTKALQLANRAGIAASTSIIWQVRGQLPSIIKDLLKADEYVDWAAFTMEVKGLKGNRFLEKKEQYNRQEYEVNVLCVDVVCLQQCNPTQNSLVALQNQLLQMSINPMKAPNTPLGNSTVLCMPTSQMNQYQQPTFTHQPVTSPQLLMIKEDLKNAIQQLVLSFIHYLDTLAGQAAYTVQIAQWNTKWGEHTRVTQETGYSLKPGTTVIASSKCFNCGTHGYNGQNCVLPANHAE